MIGHQIAIACKVQLCAAITCNLLNPQNLHKKDAFIATDQNVDLKTGKMPKRPIP